MNSDTNMANETACNRLSYVAAKSNLRGVTLRNLLLLSSFLSGIGLEEQIDTRSALKGCVDEARRQRDNFQREIAEKAGSLDATEIEWRRRILAIADPSDLESLTSLIRGLGDLQCLALITRVEQVHAIARENGGLLKPAAETVHAQMTATRAN